MSEFYREYRCRECKKLLFRGVLVESAVEVKCKGCHAVNTFQGTAMNELVCYKYPCPFRVTQASMVKKNS